MDMKINKGDLVRRVTDSGQGKVGIVTEVDTIGGHLTDHEGIKWLPIWVQWIDYADWEMEYEHTLEVLAQNKK